MKRAFEGTRKRSWLIAAIAVLMIVSGVVLVPRFLPLRISAPITGESESYGIQAAPESKTVLKAASTGKHAGTSPSIESPRQETQPGKPETIAAPPAVSKAVSKAVSNVPSVQSSDTVNKTVDVKPSPAMVKTRPKVLGQLKVRRKETLGGMIQKIYGIFNTQYLNALLELNPHVIDPNTIDIGEVIVFPALPLDIKQHAQPHWWVEVSRRDTIESAFDILRLNRELAASSRLIPFWRPTAGLQFSIVLNRYYYDETSAVNMRNSLAQDLFTESRLLSSWGPEALFYANPYLGL